MSTETTNRGCLTAIMGLFGQKPQKADLVVTIEPEEKLPYKVRDDFISPAELSFYHVLELAVQSRVTILSKVRMADVFFVTQPNINRKYLNFIVGKHIDFLLCEPATLKPLAGIELDDASHERADRVERDDFVNRVFDVAELPLLHFAVRRTYRIEDIQSALVGALPELFARPEESIQAAANPILTSPDRLASAQNQSGMEMDNAAGKAPICPKCQIPMVLRTVSSGEHKGKQFWGCSNYPNCRQVKPIPTP